MVFISPDQGPYYFWGGGGEKVRGPAGGLVDQP